MFKLLKYLKGHIAQSVAAPLFKIMEAIFELIIPLVVAAIIDKGIPSGDTAYIWKMGGIMLSLGICGYLFSMTCQYLAAKSSLNFGTNLRRALYRHINTLSFSELDKIRPSSLVTRLNSDIVQTQVGVAMFIRLVLRAPVLVIGATVMAMLIDLKISLIFFAVAILLSAILYFITSRSQKNYTNIQKKLDNIALLSRENLSGARVVRAFNNQAEEQDDFLAAAKELEKASNKAAKISNLLNPLTYAVINVAVILILYFGGFLVNNGTLTSGNIIALVNYLSQILLAMVVLAQLFVIFSKAGASAKRINEVFALTPSIVDTAITAPEKVEGSPKIKLDNVTFSYTLHQGAALRNISLSLFSGQTLGIIGSTGSGKTTLINVLSRFYDIAEGKVEIDGVNVRDYPAKLLRQKIAIVPQKTALFFGTIRENIQMGDTDISDGAIWDALKAAQADEFVLTLEKGLDTIVKEGGKNFSGGQKQRLTIARALVRKSDILILDDSSSALDYITDARLRKAIKQTAKETTLIMISQRATSIKAADLILVLDEGKVAGLGKHGELIRSCEVYKEICESQSSV